MKKLSLKNKKRNRESSSGRGSNMRHRSQTPVRRKRSRYSRSQSPEAYQNTDLRNRDHTFDRSDNSTRRSHVEHWKLRRNFDVRDDQPNRRNGNPRLENNGRSKRFRDTPDRNLGPYAVKGETYTSFRDTPDRSRDDRGIYENCFDTSDRSPLTYWHEGETFDRIDDAPDNTSMVNERSDYSNQSYVFPKHRRSRRMSFSPNGNEDFHVEHRYEHRGIPSKCQSRYKDDDFHEYGRTTEGLHASTFYKSRERKKVLTTPEICKFYNNEGTCKRGKSCTFLHLCKYFINDDCKFGVGCKRSHDVLDKQPRTILERHGMIPDNFNPYNFTNTREITDLIKDKLKNLEAKLQRDKTKANVDRPILQHQPTSSRVYSIRASSPLDIISDDETASYVYVNESREKGANDVMSRRSDFSDDIPKNDIKIASRSSEDYIPLESKIRTNVKDKKITQKKQKKTSKRSKEYRENQPIKSKVDMEPAPPQQCVDDTNKAPLESTITFESQNPSRKFHVRKDNENWQISNMCDVWMNLDEADSEVFCEMYNRAFEIGEKVADLPKE